MDDEGHGEIGAGRWGEGAFKRGETGGVDGEVREREAVLSVPEMVDDDGDNDASPQLGTLPRRTSSAFLRVDSLARNKSLKSHTQYGSKHFEHWPVWHASFGTLLANFTSPVWIYNLTTYSMVRFFWSHCVKVSRNSCGPRTPLLFLCHRPTWANSFPLTSSGATHRQSLYGVKMIWNISYRRITNRTFRTRQSCV